MNSGIPDGDFLEARHYPEVGFGGFTRCDGNVEFYARVNAILRPEHVLLDAGCGRGESVVDDPNPWRRKLHDFRGRCRRVIGIDVSAEAADNPTIDEFHRIESDRWPLADASVDICVCDYVLEHVSNPGAFLREAYRCLVPGGILCLRTTNSWSYPAWFARLVPNRGHGRLIAKVQHQPRAERDVFPVRYACNSIPRLRRELRRCGFHAVVYGINPEPSYLSFAGWAYALGVVYQRVAPAFLGPALLAFGRVPKSRT